MVQPSVGFDKIRMHCPADAIRPLVGDRTRTRQASRTSAAEASPALERLNTRTSCPVAETGDLCILHQVTEVLSAHMHQRPVIAAFEVDVVHLAQAFVEQHRHIIG